MTRVDVVAQLAALERAHGGRIGAARPSDEPVRFLPPTTLAFAPSDAEPCAEDPRALVTRFLALSGADGALPPYLVEEIAREDPDRPVRRALLTPFHHRATALLFRSIHRCRIPEETRSFHDAWPTRLASLVRGDVGADAFDRQVALVLAPLLHGRPSASSLARALQVLSRRWLGGAPITLSERTGVRVAIDGASRARLGRSRLGDDALLGATVRDPASAATITVGPLAPEQEGALAPGGPAWRALALVTRWLGDSTTEIGVLVRSHDAPQRLGSGRLGQTTLGGREPAIRERRLALDATTLATPRQGLRRGEPTRPSKELSCDRIPVPSSSV